MNNSSYAAAIILGILGLGGGYYIGMKYAGSSGHQLSTGNKATDLRLTLDKLWSDHVIWTRQYIVSALAQLPDVKVAEARLMKNQEDLGNAIVPLYGKQAGDALTKLLKEHIAIAGELVKAAAANNNEEVKAADKKWHDNAVEIASLLSSANPHWTKEGLTAMLNDHLALTAKEATLRLAQDWKADAENFDKIFDQSLMMAKDMTTGIVQQFPEKF